MGRSSLTMRIFLFGVVACLGVAAMMENAAAATPTPSPSPSPRVIGSVVARARTPYNATSVSIRTFPREAYRDQGQPAMTAVLTQTPGIDLVGTPFRNGALTLSQQLPSIRYGLPYETAVALDGVRISLPSSGVFDLALIPTFAVGDVEVVRGPGDPGQLGGSANGSLNIRTADPGGARRAFPETSIDSRGGSFSDLSYGGTIPGATLSFASMAAVDGNRGGLPFGWDADLRKMLLLDVRDTPAQNVAYRVVFLGSNLERSLAGQRVFTLSNGSVVPFYVRNGDEFKTFRFGKVEASLTRGAVTYGAQLFADAVVDLQQNGLPNAQSRDSLSGGSLSAELHGRHVSANIDLSHELGRADSNLPDIAPLTGAQSNTWRVQAAATDAFDARNELDLSGMFAQRTVNFASPAEIEGAARLGFAHRFSAGLTARVSAGASSIPQPLSAIANANGYVVAFGGPRSAHFASTAGREEAAAGWDAGVEYRLHGDTTTLSADVYRTHVFSPYVAGARYAGNALLLQTRSGPDLIEEGVEVSLVQFKRVGMGYQLQLTLPRTFAPSIDSSFYDFGNLAALPGRNLTGGSGIIPQLGDIASMRVPYARGYGEISYKWQRGSRASLGALYEGSNNATGLYSYLAFNANLELSLGANSKVQFSAENLTNTRGGNAPYLDGGALLPAALGIAYTEARGVLPPATLRVMFRRSFGAGIYER